MARKQYFTLRLNRIKLLDNREWGPAEIRILSFVSAGNTPLPALEGYLATNDDAQKKQILKASALELVSLRQLVEIHHVKDDSIITFGSEDAGISVYTNRSEIPTDLNWSLVVVERDGDVRDIGTFLTELVRSDKFDGFLDNVITAIGMSTTPAITAAFKIGKFLAAQAGRLIANNKDDQVGVLATSLNRFEHYPKGERKRNGVRGANGNIFVDYTLFGTVYEA